MLQGHVGGHRPATPRQRHSCAAEAVVVYHGLAVELFGLQDKTGVAMRAQADGGSNHALEGDPGKRQVDGRARRA
jgi:hypothetical protein